MFEQIFSRWLSIGGTKYFWWAIKKNFSPNFHFGQLDEFLDGFSKFWSLMVKICISIWYFWVVLENEHTRNEFNRTLSIHGTNFIAGWAYAEWILSLAAEHMRKCLKVKYLGRIALDFQKSRVTGPWDHKDSVSAKKENNKFMLVYLQAVSKISWTIISLADSPKRLLINLNLIHLANLLKSWIFPPMLSSLSRFCCRCHAKSSAGTTQRRIKKLPFINRLTLWTISSVWMCIS